MNLINLYRTTPKKEDREWFKLNTVFLFAVLLINFLVLYFEAGTQEYYHANNGLLISIIIVTLLFIAARTKLKDLSSILFSKKDQEISISLYDYGYLVLAISFILSGLAFIFVLDLSFIQNYGLRISAVVGIAIIKIIKDLYLSKK